MIEGKKKSFIKKLKFTHTCRRCNELYKSADIKGSYCEKCKTPRSCKCGCGKTVKSPSRDYCKGCKIRGKTYKQIYKTETPSCGYQRGDRNVAKREDIREKIREGVRKSYTEELRNLRRVQKLELIDKGLIFGKMRYENDRREKFRSILEFNFANRLFQEGIPYQYERTIFKLPPNEKGYKRKNVDFTVGDLLIEITGIAHINWKNTFLEKIRLLRRVTDLPILVLTYPEKVTELKELEKLNITVMNYFETDTIINILKSKL